LKRLITGAAIVAFTITITHRNRRFNRCYTRDQGRSDERFRGFSFWINFPLNLVVAFYIFNENQQFIYGGLNRPKPETEHCWISGLLFCVPRIWSLKFCLFSLNKSGAQPYYIFRIAYFS